MNKYLLQEEQKKINTLINILEKELYRINTKEIKDKLTNIIKNNKDHNLKDLLNKIQNDLSEEMSPLLKNNLTKGLQYGIKTNNFLLETYGGNVSNNTFFSFDSISKIITSIITMKEIRTNKINLNTKIKELNKEYNLNTNIESILKFTADIKTPKRIDYLSKEETINLLKQCKENLLQENYYEYNDIGYMILRQTIPNFIEELNNTINTIDNTNLTYHITKTNITGGKINETNITPDPKGRDIMFPGHTGLYGNIEGLINLFDKLINTNILLTTKEKNILWTLPYNKLQNNNQKYINKIAGIYKLPNNLPKNYDKLIVSNIPNSTTKNALSSAGTCGSWILNDTLSFGTYTEGILTNPYSYVENKIYEKEINNLNNTSLKVNKKGVIINYPNELKPYKIILTNYALILKLIEEYLNIPKNNKNTIKLIKEIKLL